MSADSESAATALSLPVCSPEIERVPPPAATSPNRSPSPTSTSPTSAPWAHTRRTSSAARLSRRSQRRPYSRAAEAAAEAAAQPLHRQLLAGTTEAARRSLEWFYTLSGAQKTGVCAAAGVVVGLGLVALAFSHRILAALVPLAAGWRALPGGWMLVWLAVFVTAFPPVVGYSTAVTTAGFVYGIRAGWPVAATASVAGAACAFMASRGVLAGYVQRLVGENHKFVALSQVLRRDGVLTLAMIRVCPLPYSLSNGFLATVPNIRVWAFAAATALASPKLLVHVFIGSRLAMLLEEGDKMSTGDRIVNYTSMAAGGLLGVCVSLYIYKRTMARAAELAREEADAAAGVSGDHYEHDGPASEYADSATESSRLMAMMDPDAAALAMDDDDISLWEAEPHELNGGVYRDSWDEEAAISREAKAPEVDNKIIGPG